MKIFNHKSIAAAILTVSAVGALAVAGVAQAGAVGGREGETGQSEAQESAKEAQFLASARVSLADAARVAEQHTGLKAAEAELDDEAAAPAWEVSVGSGAQEKTVIVDAMNGQVKSVAADDGEEAEGGADAD